MQMESIALRSIVGCSVGLMLQTPVPLFPEWLNEAEHLTLTGGLIIALVVLWRSLGAERERTLKNTEAVAAALVAATDSNKELRAIITESVEAKRELKGAIDRLDLSIGHLPCTEEHKRL
jgi:hypothetical protein